MHIHRQGVSVGEVQGFSVPLDSTHSEKGIELVAKKNEVILKGIDEKPRKKNGRDGEIRTRDLLTPSGNVVSKGRKSRLILAL